MWNKAYNSAVCKKAFLEIDDKYIVVAEDLYAFFILAFMLQDIEVSMINYIFIILELELLIMKDSV